MIRDTSFQAYATVLPDLSEKQAVVLATLKESPPLTNAEIAQALGWTINRVTPRTGELVKLGRVADAGKRKCRITGRMAHTWAVAGNLPKKTRIVYLEVEVDGVRLVRPVEQTVD